MVLIMKAFQGFPNLRHHLDVHDIYRRPVQYNAGIMGSPFKKY
jgi:hypothetical protein